MKPLSALIIFLMIATTISAQNVGINNLTPHGSAQLDITSTNKGLLIPRLTTAQRIAIVSPAPGLMVYDSTAKSFWFHNGSGWSNVSNTSFTLPYEATVNLNTPAFKITNSGFGAAIQAVTTNEFGYALQASTNANYGYGVYAYSRSPNGIGVYALADSAIAVKAESGKGIGLDAISTDSSAIRARIIKGANADPVILASHAGGGTALLASSNTGYAIQASTNSAIGFSAIYGIQNGSTGAGVRGEANFAIGSGIYGTSSVGTGVQGASSSGTALKGTSTSGYGLDVSGKVKIAGGNTNPAAGAVLTSVDASGNAVWQVPVTAAPKVGFRAYGVSSTESAGTPNNSIPNNTFKKVEFQTESYDTHGDFIVTGTTPATSGKSVFTAPFTGVYHFDAAVHSKSNLLFSHYAHHLRLMMNYNGSVSTIAEVEIRPQIQDGTTISMSMDVYLSADAMVWVEFKQYNLSFTSIELETSGAQSFFSGHLIYTQ